MSALQALNVLNNPGASPSSIAMAMHIVTPPCMAMASGDPELGSQPDYLAKLIGVGVDIEPETKKTVANALVLPHIAADAVVLLLSRSSFRREK